MPRRPSGVAPNGLKEILRTRRDARSRRSSCFPCRERKVACDRKQPCSTCIKRDYPDLCLYRETHDTAVVADGSPSVSRPLHTEHGAISYPAAVRNRHNRLQSDQIAHLANAAGPDREISHESLAVDEGASSLKLLDDNSIVALAQGTSSHLTENSDSRSAFGTGVLPLLGVRDSNTTTDVPSPLGDVVKSLWSAEQEVFALYECYRHRAHDFLPIVLDLDELEQRLCSLMHLRDEADADVASVMSKASQWFCLLHAILAAGAQLSDFPLKRRLSLSQSYAKGAFDLLNATNYLARPYKEALETVLLLGAVLQNNMEPQAAWALGGTAIRLAYCMGVHDRQASPRSSLTKKNLTDIRLAIVWQDSLLSLAFDRVPGSFEMNYSEDLPVLCPEDPSKYLTYHQAMHWLCHITLRHLAQQKIASPAFNPLSLLGELKLIDACLSSHLKHRQACSSLRSTQEYYGFELHKNFVISSFCRPVLSERSSASLNDNDKRHVLEQLKAALKRSAQAYLSLRSVTKNADRSWAFVHNGLVSVLLLSLMKETRQSADTRSLQAQLIESLLAAEKDFSSGPSRKVADHLSDTHTKALKALQTLHRLTEEDTRPQTRPQAEDEQDVTGSTPYAFRQGEAVALTNASTSLVDTELHNPEDLLLPFELNDSPLVAFDYIMSEPFVDASGLQNPFLE